MPISLQLNLKADHKTRPIWISFHSRIIMEAFSPVAEQAQDLLLAISEPISRPRYIHEYQLTENSLFAAVSVGLEASEIIVALDKFCKTDLPSIIIDFILSSTKKYGRARLILKDNKFWLNAKQDVLEELKADQIIGKSVESEAVIVLRDTRPNVEFVAPTETDEIIDIFDEFANFDPDLFLANIEPNNRLIEYLQTPGLRAQDPEPNLSQKRKRLEPELDGHDLDLSHSIQIKKEFVESVKQRCNELSYPVVEEYDFHADHYNPPLDIDLKPVAHLRDYQQKSLSKLFSSGRARSGIIVLPCGSGKTLVGVTACCTIKKSAIVLCNSTLSVDQWAREFRQWSTIKHTQIARFSSEVKEKFEGEGILVTTYSMIAFTGKRAAEAQEMIEFIKGREWGFLLLDEVHIVPADMFKKTLGIVSSHSKLGLTATLLREDDKIAHLNWLIGPKLYEANWQDLARAGYIANVACRYSNLISEVWCTMTYPFYREYLRESGRRRQLLYIMNPRKIQACQYLIQMHENLVTVINEGR